MTPDAVTGLDSGVPPTPQVFDKPRISNCKPPELARRHLVLRKISLDLIQKLHNRPTHFRLVFLLCSV